MLVDALRSGSGRVSTIAIAALVTLAVYAAVPQAAYLDVLTRQLSTPVLQAALFGVIFMLTFLLVRKMFYDYDEMHGQPIPAIFAALAVTIIIIAVWLQAPALEAVWRFGPQVKSIFGEAFRFWWLLIALAALAFAKA